MAVFNRTTSKVDDFIAGRAKGKRFVGCHTPRRTGRKPGHAAQGDADGQGRPGGRRVHRAPDSAALARRRDHRRRQHATFTDTERRTQYVESKGLLFIGTGVSGGEEGALKGPSMMPGGSERGLAAGQADLPGDRRQGRARTTTFPAANGSARAAPAIT